MVVYVVGAGVWGDDRGQMSGYVASGLSVSDGQTTSGAGRADAPQSAPTTHGPPQIRRRRRPTISTGHVGACPDAAVAAAHAEYIIKQTAHTSEPSAPAGDVR